MCDRIAIINKGNLVAFDTTERLLERIESKIIKFKVKNLSQFNNIKLNGVKFSKSDSVITAMYDKNKFKFDPTSNGVHDTCIQTFICAGHMVSPSCPV